MATADRRGAALLARIRLCACIDGALAALAEREPDDAAVHDARRELKRARALLRLLRATLQVRIYRRADLLLRDAGRSLAQARDVAVLAMALERMRIAAGLSRRDVGIIVRAFGRERRAVDLAAAARGARSALRLARTRLLRAQLLDRGEAPLVAGLTRIYRRGRRGYAGVGTGPSTERLHVWRRHVKRYWHALEVLVPARPRVIRALAREAHFLADLLGEHHDLALLSARLGAARLPVATRRRLRVAIAARRTRIEIDVLALGALLYAAGPRRARTRAVRWWQGWASVARRAPAAARPQRS